jgi:hypothetical protein
MSRKIFAQQKKSPRRGGSKKVLLSDFTLNQSMLRDHINAAIAGHHTRNRLSD